MSGVISLLVFLAVAFLIAGLFLSQRKEEEIKERLLNYTRNSKQTLEGEKSGLHLDVGRLLASVSRVFASYSYTARLQEDLIRADIPLKGEEYLTIWVGLAAGIPVVLYLLTMNWALAVTAALVGLIGPKMYVNARIESRRHKLNQQLGDALIIMANALRAGFSFQQAMETVRRELPPPISTEFEWCLREMNLGASTEESLLNMGSRAASDDLDMVISAVLIQRQVGGNLAQILENISRTIRERARIKGEIRTLTAQGRISGLIIGLLPVVLLLLLCIINPTYMSTMTGNTMGLLILGGAFFAEIIGVFIIKKLVEVDF